MTTRHGRRDDIYLAVVAQPLKGRVKSWSRMRCGDPARLTYRGARLLPQRVSCVQEPRTQIICKQPSSHFILRSSGVLTSSTRAIPFSHDSTTRFDIVLIPSQPRWHRPASLRQQLLPDDRERCLANVRPFVVCSLLFFSVKSKCTGQPFEEFQTRLIVGDFFLAPERLQEQPHIQSHSS